MIKTALDLAIEGIREHTETLRAETTKAAARGTREGDLLAGILFVAAGDITFVTNRLCRIADEERADRIAHMKEATNA